MSTFSQTLDIELGLSKKFSRGVASKMAMAEGGTQVIYRKSLREKKWPDLSKMTYDELRERSMEKDSRGCATSVALACQQIIYKEKLWV